MVILGFHIHGCDRPWSEAPPWAIEQRELTLRVLTLLGLVLRTEQRTESEMKLDFTKAAADIAAQTTVLRGVVAAQQALTAANAAQSKQIEGLQAALDAAGVEDPAVQAALDAIDQGVKDNTTLVANLVPNVTVNTPTPSAEAAAAARDASAPASA